MASVKIDLPKDTWVDVTLGNEKGTITHYAGRSDILFVQSVNIPNLSPPESNAIADVLKPNVDKVKYYGGLSSQKIWACSIDYNSVVVSTEAEV